MDRKQVNAKALEIDLVLWTKVRLEYHADHSPLGRVMTEAFMVYGEKQDDFRLYGKWHRWGKSESFAVMQARELETGKEETR